LSASFHGRDLFAPVAGQLARGEHPNHKPRAPEIDRYGDWPNDLPEIVYIDRYGNAMTGLRGALLPREARLAVSGRVLKHARTFPDVRPARPSGTRIRTALPRSRSTRDVQQTPCSW